MSKTFEQKMNKFIDDIYDKFGHVPYTPEKERWIPERPRIII
jgi:hypothetical protein